MNETNENIEYGVSVRAGFDRELILGGGGSVRYLVAEIMAPPSSPEGQEPPPLNIALVIDCSGSMSGDKLDKAKESAVRVAESFSPKDYLSLVSFTEHVEAHFPATGMDEAGKSLAVNGIASLIIGGTTNLAGGWLAGVESVARRMQQGGNFRNHVLLLSDGLANVGLTDPEKLAEHASKLCDRGVLSSAVGIGDDYSTEQLSAITESGGGRLHDAERAEEIAEVVLGELGEVGKTVAENVELVITYPETFKTVVLGNYPVRNGNGTMRVSVGSLTGSATRCVVMKVVSPPGVVGESSSFNIALDWNVPGSKERSVCGLVTATLRFDDEQGVANQPRDTRLAKIVARVWQAGTVRHLAKLNRDKAFMEARDVLERELLLLKEYCCGLPDTQHLVKELERLKTPMRRDLGERTRKEIYISSTGTIRNQTDFRSHKRKHWSNSLPADAPVSGQESFAYNLINGHVVLLMHDKRIILDTGSPVSCAAEGLITLLGKPSHVARNTMGLYAGDLSRLIGEDVDGLLGMDLLMQFNVSITPENGLVSLSDRQQQTWGHSVPMQFLVGVPVVEAKIDGRKVKAVIDTSARVSYMPTSLFHGRQIIGEADDFYPLFGDFRTSLVSATLQLGGAGIRIAFGQLPSGLAQMMEMMGIEAIIGTQILDSWDIFLNFPRAALSVRPKE